MATNLGSSQAACGWPLTAGDCSAQNIRPFLSNRSQAIPGDQEALGPWHGADILTYLPEGRGVQRPGGEAWVLVPALPRAEAGVPPPQNSGIRSHPSGCMEGASRAACHRVGAPHTQFSSPRHCLPQAGGLIPAL